MTGSAAYQRTYRERKRAAGARAARGRHGKGTKGGKHKSLFDAGHFVAVDGEGFNRGEPIVRTIGALQREYVTRDHEYALLSASDGTELYNPAGRLTTKQCLDFLLDIRRRDKHAILVCFGGSYDMCHMLAFGLSRDDIETLLHGDGTLLGRKTVDVTLTDHATGERHDYRIEVRMRKSLSVWRWPAGADKRELHLKRDGTRIMRMTKCESVTLWDVWGFFQGTFVGALKAWLPQDPDTKLIADMKAKRSDFQRSEIDTVRAYNAMELRCLVDMMELVRDAIRAIEPDKPLSISRWDGAGAIAGAMLAHHDIKQHMAASPPEVFNAACVAYSGGHIEACKIGHYEGTIHHYDINSAYPNEFRNLPSLVGGAWHKSGNPATDVPSGFTLVRLEFRFTAGLPFYPLFYRQPSGSILYPERGAGWYWFPEYDVARKFVAAFGAIEFRVVEWWHYRTSSNVQPFGFIEAYYEQRKQIVAEIKRSGIPNGAEKTLKHGYNSVYGKTAQQVGARWKEGKIAPPSYFQLEWAGYVTAGCRAKLMEAAIQEPDAIISFATDGLYSTKPLNLYTPKSKELGAWEYQTHTGITIVMPGVYWLYNADNPIEPITHYSRGFDKDTMKDDVFVRRAWMQKQSMIDVKSKRMITLGTALMSDNFWDLRGYFVETVRALQLNGDNSKRYPIAMHNVKLHKSLVNTYPQDLQEDYDLPLTNLMSAPYPITWLKTEDAPETAEIAEYNDADRSFYFDREAMILA